MHDDDFFSAQYRANHKAFFAAIKHAARNDARRRLRSAGPLAPLVAVYPTPQAADDDAVGAILFGEFDADAIARGRPIGALLDDVESAYSEGYKQALREQLDPARFDLHLPF